MEISGSFYAPSPYSGSDPAKKYAQSTNQQQQATPRPAPQLRQVVHNVDNEASHRQRRFYSVARELSHSAQQALTQYQDSDDAGKGELMNRVDVYA